MIEINRSSFLRFNYLILILPKFVQIRSFMRNHNFSLLASSRVEIELFLFLNFIISNVKLLILSKKIS